MSQAAAGRGFFFSNARAHVLPGKQGFRTQYADGARAVTRACLVARQRPAVPEDVVDHRRALVSPRAATSSSTAWSAQARISTSSGEPCSSRKPASMRPDQTLVELEHAVEPQDVGDKVVGEQRQAVRCPRPARCPARWRSAAAICARLKNGTGGAVVGGDVAPRGPRGQRARPAAPPSPSAEFYEPEEAPEVLDRDALAELAQRAREQRHQLVRRLLPERRGHLGRLDRGQLRRRPRPAGAQAPPRRCGSPTARSACAGSGTSRSRS